jgi:hypothetical protein
VRRLRDFQTVSINLAHGPLDAVVAATSGDIAYLEIDPARAPEAALRPARAEVAFLYDGRPIMLTGVADRAGREGLLAFQVQGRGQLPNKRATARLGIELTALVAVPDRSGSGEVATIDVGAGGALLADRGLGRAGEPVELTIALPGTRDVVGASGHVARVSSVGTGVAFDEIEPGDVERLNRLVLSVRIELAQRFAGRP